MNVHTDIRTHVHVRECTQTTACTPSCFAAPGLQVLPEPLRDSRICRGLLAEHPLDCCFGSGSLEEGTRDEAEASAASFAIEQCGDASADPPSFDLSK